MRVKASGGSDTGLRRAHNEDDFFIHEETGVFVVADGLGGRNAGEVASHMMTDMVRREVDNLSELLNRYRKTRDTQARQEVLRFLPQIIERSNEEIYNAAQENPEQRGMGTTALLFLPLEEDAFVSHVGDSRLYLYRENQLFQVTEDHSLVMRLFKLGYITAKEMIRHPKRNVILKAVGSDPTVEVDTLYLDIFPGDTFLLCTDGLTDMVSNEELAEMLSQWKGDDFVREAIELANARGGKDNITAVVVEILAEAVPSLAAVPRRMGIPEKVTVLQDIFLFAGLSDQECVKINRILYERDIAADTRIITQGSPGDEFFIVVSGKVGVWRGNVRLSTLGPGQHFGEMAIVKGELRSATVVADEAVKVLVIGRSDFMELLKTDQALGNKILWALVANFADRLNVANEMVAKG